VPVYFRIVKTNPPQPDDFTSNRDKGLPQRGAEVGDPSLWTGISLYDSRDRAARQARRYRLGGYVATLDIPDSTSSDSDQVRKTLGDPHHYTLWGEPAHVLSLVVRVDPVSE
jgi:hypothetical protein